MKDALLIGFACLTLFTVLSWASAPAATYAEHTARVAAEREIVVLQTRVAVLLPTPVRRVCGSYYGAC